MAEDGLPSARSLWFERVARQAGAIGERLDPEKARRYRHLLREFGRAEDTGRRPDKLALIGPHGHKTWQPHPHAGDRECAERRQREIFVEIGELLGIGRPPWVT